MKTSGLCGSEQPLKKTACKQDFTLLQAIFCGDGRLCVGVYRVEAQSLFFTLVLFTLIFSPKNVMFSSFLHRFLYSAPLSAPQGFAPKH
jgi:hypothetical protein